MAKWQLGKTALRRLKIGTIVVFILGFLYFLPSLLLRIPQVQEWAGREASRELTKLLGTKVLISRVGAEGWSELSLLDVRVLDSLQRPALDAKYLGAGLELRPLLFEERLLINKLRLLEAKFLIDIDSVTGRSNIQPIINALSSDSQEPSTLTLDLRNILLRNASLRLLSSGSPREYLDSVSLQISKFLLSPDSLRADLEELSFRTDKGFRLKDSKALVSLYRDTLRLSNLEVYLPHSYADIPQARLNIAGKGLNLIEQIHLRGLSLALQDLSPLYAPLKDIAGDTLRVSASLERMQSALQLKDLETSLGNKVYLKASAGAETNSQGGLEALRLDLSKLLIDAQQLPDLPKYIPALVDEKALLERLSSLGQVAYAGQLRMPRPAVLSLTGALASGLGTIQMTSDYSHSKSGQSLKAMLRSSGFNLGPILGLDFGRLVGEVESDLNWAKGANFPSGATTLQLAQLEYQGQRYSGVNASLASTNARDYSLRLLSSDTRFPLSVDGTFALLGKDLRNVKVALQASNLPIRNFVKDLDNLSVEGEIEVSSLDLDKIQGSAFFSNLRLNVKDKPLDLSGISLDISTLNREKLLRLITPWANIRLLGDFEIKHLADDALSVVGSQIPIFSSLIPKRRAANTVATLEAELDSVPQPIQDLLKFPLSLNRKALLKADINTVTDSLRFSLLSPEAWLGGHRIEDLVVLFDDHRLRASGNAFMYGGTQLIGADVSLLTRSNNLKLSADLGQDSLGVKHGVMNVGATLSSIGDKPLKSLRDLKAQIDIDRSRLRIHTSFWDIAPASIAYAGGLLQVNGLGLSTEGRRLSIDGGIGNWANHRGLSIQLENINLRYILEAAGVYFDLLDTDLTGTINASLQGKHIVAQAAVRSPHFFVNKQDVGAIDLGLNFTSEDLFIHLKGDVQQKHGGKSLVDGWIKPANGAGLDIRFDAEDLDLGFIGSFMDTFLSKLEGYGTGQARLHGLFEQGVTISGESDIKRGKVGVSVLGTEYKFEHKVTFDDTRINLEGIRLYDDEGHSGVLHGYVGHQYFGNFDIQLRAEDLRGVKVLQTSSPKIMPAYGKAYASGRATMTGSDTKLLLDVDLTSEEGSDVMLDFNTITAGRDESLMRFVRLRPDSVTNKPDTLVLKPNLPAGIIDLKLKLKITPTARLAMRLGEDNNSILRGRAEGVLQISAPSSASPEVYGTLAVREGEYLLNLQQLAMKRFTVREGGSLAFRGDPMKATLNNLNAVYALTANIADLDESISQLTARTNIPVNCLLRLSGEVTQPTVRFGLELPSADAEIERRVRALLNTEDAITRQMLYLIALGKFYTSDSETRTTSTTNNWTAVASSAISEQLSSILGGLSENIKLGTSIKTKTTDFEDTDIELNFSGTWLDNRLTINGNIGYHDNPYLNNQYLGEFEFEYRLNKSGSLRLKGYNRYNNMYQYLRQSLLTQGLGFLYRQRFDSLKDLFRPTRTLKPDTLDTISKADTLVPQH